MAISSSHLHLWDHPQLQPLILRDVKPTEKTIGTGAFGSVEEVEIPGALCAAKKLHHFLANEEEDWVAEEVVDKNVAKFVAECKIMGRLRHPNIVQFLGLWFSPAEGLCLPAIVMEKMLMSLHHFLDPDGPKSGITYKQYIPLGLKCSILQDIAQGIAYLHKQKPPVIHRDLTAANVLLNSSMVAKIADLGMARILPDKVNATMTRQPGASVYMPPEALEDKSQYNTSIDMFSLGVIVIFMLAQEFPRDLKGPTYTSAVKCLVARTELERRENYTAKIYSVFPKTHPLIQLIESCLENSAKSRPSIDQALWLLDQAMAGIQDCTHLHSNKLQLLQEIEHNRLEQKQLKCDAWREEVEKLSPLRDEVAQLHQENARLKQELTQVSEDNMGLSRQLQEMSSSMKMVEWERLMQEREIKEMKHKLLKYKCTYEHQKQEIARLKEKLQQTCTAPDDDVNVRLNSESFSCSDEFDLAVVKPKGEWISFTSNDSHSHTSTQSPTSDASFEAVGGAGRPTFTQADASTQLSSRDYALFVNSNDGLDSSKCNSLESRERAVVEGNAVENRVDTLETSMQPTHDPDWQGDGESDDSFHSQESQEEAVTDDDSEDENLLSVESTSPYPPEPESHREAKPHEKKETWFMEVDRNCAIELLKDSVNGTFLCRPTSQQTKLESGEVHTHTIDIVCDGVQQHVRIFQHGGKYGFTPPYTYSSLMELVLHYSEHSVSLQNSALYTTLKFPVLKDGS